MRNNEERLGIPDVVPPVMAAAGGFDFAIPEQIVELPSKGKFYPEGHPLFNKDTITIRFMTAADEDILSNKSFLKKGTAIDKMLQHVIVDKSIDVLSLLVGDRNALLVAARITGYGKMYDTKMNCPYCGEKVSYSFDLEAKNDAVIAEKQDALEGVKLTANNTFVVSLPLMKVDVECKFLTGRDERMLLEQTEMRKKAKLEETTLTDQFKLIIESVNGRRDNASINKVIENMPARDSKFLRDAYDKVNPAYELRQMFKCSNCESEMEVEVPLSADFFWFK